MKKRAWITTALLLGITAIFVLCSDPIFAAAPQRDAAEDTDLTTLWRDPAHRFEYVGDDPFSSALYRPGKDTLHLSVGAGVAFKNFQIDIGADFSDYADSFAVSAIYSF